MSTKNVYLEIKESLKNEEEWLWYLLINEQFSPGLIMFLN